MGFKDILVHIDSTPQSADRLKLAVKLARKYDAFLTGIYVTTHPHYAPSLVGAGTREAAAGEQFRQQTTWSRVNARWLAVDWPVAGASMADIINRYAHKKDLIIVGQSEPGSVDPPADLAERVVLGAGRPVLVVPYAGNFSDIGERVIVAWKDGRASARALNDAMPLLKKANKVCVMTVNKAHESPQAEIADDDIVAHLERHRINVVQEKQTVGDIPVASLLMNYAWENGCDLLVMGANANNPGGAPAVGPVAKELFEQMTVPVLMSH